MALAHKETTKMNKKGQALVESITLLPFCIILMGALLWGTYTYFSSYLLDHWLYDSVLCIQKELTVHQCKQNLKSKVNKLPFINLTDIDLHLSFSLIHARIEYRDRFFNTYKKKISQSQNLNRFSFEKY